MNPRWGRTVVWVLLALPLVQAAAATALAIADRPMAPSVILIPDWAEASSTDQSDLPTSQSEAELAAQDALLRQQLVIPRAVDRFASGSSPTYAPLALVIAAALAVAFLPRDGRRRPGLAVAGLASGVAAAVLQLGAVRREWYLDPLQFGGRFPLGTALTSICILSAVLLMTVALVGTALGRHPNG